MNELIPGTYTQTYPEWVRDELDKAIFDTIQDDKEYTKTVLKNIVLLRLVNIVSKGKTFDNRLDELVKLKVIDLESKQVETIKVKKHKPLPS